MAEAKLEHINLTVKDPLATAAMMVDLFDWTIRWQGEASSGGFTVHVGGSDSYLALYAGEVKQKSTGDNYSRMLGLNHIAVVVDELDTVENRVKAAGLDIYLHGNYEPGRRFYFDDKQGLEIEVVSYAGSP